MDLQFQIKCNVRNKSWTKSRCFGKNIFLFIISRFVVSRIGVQKMETRDRYQVMFDGLKTFSSFISKCFLCRRCYKSLAKRICKREVNIKFSRDAYNKHLKDLRRNLYRKKKMKNSAWFIFVIHILHCIVIVRIFMLKFCTLLCTFINYLCYCNRLKSLKVAKWRKDEWRMMNDVDFKLLRGFGYRQRN